MGVRRVDEVGGGGMGWVVGRVGSQKHVIFSNRIQVAVLCLPKQTQSIE